MSAQDETVVEDNITNLETADSTETELENLEPVESEFAETPQEAKARKFANDRAEENRRKREALEKVPKLEAELEFNKFLRKNPEAEDYEQDITEFRAKNPTIWLEQAYKYVLADKDPAKLAQLADSWNYAQANQGKTAPASGEKSFSEHVWGNINLNDMDSLRKEAEKAYANIQV